MSHQLKVLVVGNVFGKYQKLFKRVSDVNKKAGPFDLLLCVGDFFGTDIEAYNELINGSTDLPAIPTYLIGRVPQHVSKSHPNFDQGFELVDGITFLGRSGILTTSQGLRIAYLSGSYRETMPDGDNNLDHFSRDHYESLLTSIGSSSSIIDILLTNEWPNGIFTHTTIDFNQSIIDQVNRNSSSIISQLCNVSRPRYHFVGNLNIFYERPPYRNHQVINETSRNVSRFISLADINNVEKLKWIYAFNIVPSKFISPEELVAQPTGVTENPFLNISTNMAQNNEQTQSKQYFYALDSDNNESNDRKSFKRRQEGNERNQKKQLKVDLENCWFCLASPNVDKTLIVSIGEFSYLAVAKGGLTDDHMMILPIGHIRSSLEIEDSQLRKEIEMFKQSLTKFFAKRHMVPVFFERNFRSAHFQIQVIGLPEEKASSLKQASSQIFSRFDFHELPHDTDLSDVLSPGVPYFFLECPGHYNFFVRINTKKEFFPIQIGRELLAHSSLLDCSHKVDWKKCTTNSDDATKLTTQIRNEFKQFDFTI
ncbi:hypothetical protein RDWZM_003043 [Blomia tropicalis]|uniref:CWF19-like protein 1 n=1 Tax=Blomia tropicalis TaxID=40697 RepID=A0A9Q0RQG7_BLOTA|nr:hypothetical protein RDWZM_003043 [Blomia tropicalis]